MHRDINPYNLMWTSFGAPAGSNDEVYLIDLDFASYMDVDSSTEPRNMATNGYTFALPFIALDHIRPSNTPKRYYYRHDLESFFWSMWWVILGNVTKSNQTDPRATWVTLDPSANFHAKRGFLRNVRDWASDIVDELWPTHAYRTPLAQCIQGLTDMFNQGYDKLQDEEVDFATGGNTLSYEAFIAHLPHDVKN